MSAAKVFDINEAEWKSWGEGIKACVFKVADEACMQNWELQAGCGGAPHSHEAAQLTYVQTGIMQLTVDDNVYTLTPGTWAYIPSNAVHSTLNLGSQTCINIDIFLPDRDDREQSPKIRDFGHIVKEK